MDRKKTISLCMIVKNEEKYLHRCLSSIEDLVDEIIIVDTGSIDNTIGIAKEFSAKIYHYEWDNNFSNARNFSLSHATKDWIILMDADDEFVSDDKEKFIDIVNTSNKHGHYFKTLSYAGDRVGENIVSNLNLRLIKNINKYKFIGAIHEQIDCISGDIEYKNFSSEDIRVIHYGYLNDVAKDKNKRQRNIGIIKEELEKNPNNNFHLFNLGNEYFAMGDNEKAFELFDSAYKKLDFNSGYASKLVIRRIMCLHQLKRDELALKSINEGLEKYPKFTDLEFMKGMINLKYKRYTLCIDSFTRCIECGNAPFHLEFLDGCGTYRPYQALGEIYFTLDDFNRALICFQKAFELNPSLHNILYKILEITNKLYIDKEKAISHVLKYLDLKNESHIVLVTDILLKEGLYDQADMYSDKIINSKVYNNEALYFKGRILFYRKEFEEAREYFENISVNSVMYIDSLKYIFIVELIKKDCCDVLKKLERANNVLILKTYTQVYNVYINIQENSLSNEDNHEKALKILLDVLGEILTIQEFDLFESLINSLNYIQSKNILLELSKLYYKKGFKDMAINNILTSIKQLDTIDIECIEILHKEIN
ncbi:glycosyltransferase [Tepidibacter mesophilus]|uniref:glycosyltransferase n=1 Tax=Tepidibacter mesophilus TaxID=655607 RepID=UPI000C07F572|nr:TPR domain-containing glycosyltransferase [Tepidibacter mesophilus]